MSAKLLKGVSAFVILVGLVVVTYAHVHAQTPTRVSPNVTCTYSSVIDSQTWHAQQYVSNPGTTDANYSNQIVGTVEEEGDYIDHQFIGCGKYYAYVSGTDPDPTVSCSIQNYSSCDIDSDVAIWLYNGGGTYLASTSVYVPHNSTATSGYTSTVSSSNGIKFKLGWRPDLNEPYCSSGSFGIASNLCTGLYTA